MDEQKKTPWEMAKGYLKWRLKIALIVTGIVVVILLISLLFK